MPGFLCQRESFCVSWMTSSIRITYSKRQLFFCLLSPGGTQIFYDVMGEWGWQWVTGVFPYAAGPRSLALGPASLVEVIPPSYAVRLAAFREVPTRQQIPLTAPCPFNPERQPLMLSNGVQFVTSLNHNLSLLSYSMKIYLGSNGIYLILLLQRVNKFIQNVEQCLTHNTFQ